MTQRKVDAPGEGCPNFRHHTMRPRCRTINCCRAISAGLYILQRRLHTLDEGENTERAVTPPAETGGQRQQILFSYRTRSSPIYRMPYDLEILGNAQEEIHCGALTSVESGRTDLWPGLLPRRERGCRGWIFLRRDRLCISAPLISPHFCFLGSCRFR